MKTKKNKEIQVPDGFFRDVCFSFTGHLEHELRMSLLRGGAQELASMGYSVTHLILGRDPDDFIINNAKCWFEECHIVGQDWIHQCIVAGKVINPALKEADSFGVVASGAPSKEVNILINRCDEEHRISPNRRETSCDPEIVTFSSDESEAEQECLLFKPANLTDSRQSVTDTTDFKAKLKSRKIPCDQEDMILPNKRDASCEHKIETFSSDESEQECLLYKSANLKTYSRQPRTTNTDFKAKLKSRNIEDSDVDIKSWPSSPEASSEMGSNRSEKSLQKLKSKVKGNSIPRQTRMCKSKRAPSIVQNMYQEARSSEVCSVNSVDSQQKKPIKKEPQQLRPSKAKQKFGVENENTYPDNVPQQKRGTRKKVTFSEKVSPTPVEPRAFRARNAPVRNSVDDTSAPAQTAKDGKNGRKRKMFPKTTQESSTSSKISRPTKARGKKSVNETAVTNVESTRKAKVYICNVCDRLHDSEEAAKSCQYNHFQGAFDSD